MRRSLRFHQGHGVDLLITDYHLDGGETGTQVIAALRDTGSFVQSRPRDRRHLHRDQTAAP